MSAGTSRGAKAPPEKKIGPFANGVGVTIWFNHIETEQGVRAVRSVTINPRRYFDRESDQWKDAGGYNPADLPALIFALTKAQEYCYNTPLPDGEPGDGASVPEEEERFSRFAAKNGIVPRAIARGLFDIAAGVMNT